MKIPGLAWLEFTVEGREQGGSRLTQRAIFFPHGLGGRLYWLAVMPFHGIIFQKMVSSMAKKATVSDQRDSLKDPATR
jgi:hypothetical protein